MEKDVVERLRERANHICDGSAVMCEAPSKLLEEAANEIERLRDLVSVAGAVSTGQSAADIKEYLRTLHKDKADGSRESNAN